MKWNIFGKKGENEAIALFEKHIGATIKAKDALLELGAALLKGDFDIVNKKNVEISDFERDADIIRRNIVTRLYGGAFMPLMRTFLYEFADALDDVTDKIQDASKRIVYLKGKKLPSKVKEKYSAMFKEIDDSVSMLSHITTDLFSGKQGIRKNLKKVKMAEHNLDILETEVFDEMLFSKKLDPLTIWLTCDVARLLARVGDMVEASGDKILVLRLLRRA